MLPNVNALRDCVSHTHTLLKSHNKRVRTKQSKIDPGVDGLKCLWLTQKLFDW